MFTKVSVLVPTRGRVSRLKTLVDSFDEQTKDRQTAELVFRIDDDDPESAEYLSRTQWKVLIGPRLKGYQSLPVFFEELRAVATGDLLMTGNDDMVFQTPYWSTKVLAAANQYPDGVFNLGVETFNAGHFPFAIISKRAADVMGVIHPPQIYWGDVYLRDVFEHFGRAVRLPDVQIEHQWMGRTPDAVFHEAQQDDKGRWTERYYKTHRACVAAAVERLKQVAA